MSADDVREWAVRWPANYPVPNTGVTFQSFRTEDAARRVARLYAEEGAQVASRVVSQWQTEQPAVTP